MCARPRAERVGDLTLIAGTGLPPGLDPGCIAGCADNRDILITDQGNQRVIRVNRDKQIVWPDGLAGAGFNQLNNPNSAELLDNGNIPIADESNNRVGEVNSVMSVLPSASRLANAAPYSSVESRVAGYCHTTS